MKFGVQFEYHKIPEWYSDYLDYKRFKALIKRFKHKVKGKQSSLTSKAGDAQKLRGLYYLTSKRFVVPMDVFSDTHKGHNTITIAIKGSSKT